MVLKEFFEKHHSFRKLVKTAIFAGLGWAVVNAPLLGEILNEALPEYSVYLIPVMMVALTSLSNWLKHNTVLPIVGKKVEMAAVKPSKKKK